MEKFKIYTNDPYDFNDLDQILEFYTIVGKKEVVQKINANKDKKIYLKVLVDKNDNNVTFSLFQERKSLTAGIKLPDLILDDSEFTLSEAEKFIDLSEYMDLDLDEANVVIG